MVRTRGAAVLHCAVFGRDAETVELLYVQWFDTVRASARAFNRALTEKELRGPFDAYSVFPGSYFHGHPPTGAPHFGLVDVSSVLYAVPMHGALLGGRTRCSRSIVPSEHRRMGDVKRKTHTFCPKI